MQLTQGVVLAQQQLHLLQVCMQLAIILWHKANGQDKIMKRLVVQHSFNLNDD